MISLKLHYEPPFNILTNKIDEILTFDKEIKLKELFDHLYKRYGEEFKELLWDKNKKDKFSSFLSIIINGNSYRGENFIETLLKDGDDVSFLYLYFGG